MCILCGCTVVAPPSHPQGAKRDGRNWITVPEIVAHPKSWVGRYVIVRGYLNQDLDGGLFATERDAKARNLEASIGVSGFEPFGLWDKPVKYFPKGAYVIVRGRLREGPGQIAGWHFHLEKPEYFREAIGKWEK